MQFSVLHFFRENMGAKVVTNVGIDGRKSLTKTGVTAIFVDDCKGKWCLIADHQENDGVSLTNGYSEYAMAVCRAVQLDIADVTWFEFDTLGSYDIVFIKDGVAAFGPIIENGYKTASQEAMYARIAQLGLSHDDVQLRSAIDEACRPVGVPA